MKTWYFSTDKMSAFSYSSISTFKLEVSCLEGAVIFNAFIAMASHALHLALMELKPSAFNKNVSVRHLSLL